MAKATLVRVHIDCRIGGESESLAGGQIDAHVTELGGSVVRGGLGLRLGAPTAKSATHLVYKDGDRAKFHAARDAGILIVRPSWIDACVDAGRFVDAAAFAPASPPRPPPGRGRAARRGMDTDALDPSALPGAGDEWLSSSQRPDDEIAIAALARPRSRGGGGKRKRAAGGALAACAEDEDDGEGAATARKRARGATWAAPSTTSRAAKRARRSSLGSQGTATTEHESGDEAAGDDAAAAGDDDAAAGDDDAAAGDDDAVEGAVAAVAAAAPLLSARLTTTTTRRRGGARGSVTWGGASTATTARSAAGDDEASPALSDVTCKTWRTADNLGAGASPAGGSPPPSGATARTEVEDTRAEAEVDGAARAEADGAARAEADGAARAEADGAAPPRRRARFSSSVSSAAKGMAQSVASSVSSSGSAFASRLRRRGGGDPIRARVDDDDDDASSAAARSRRTTPTEVASPTELMSDDGVGAQPHSPAMPSSAVARAQFSSVRARARDSDARAAEDADAADDDEELPLEARLRQRAAGTSDRISFASAADGDARDADSADDAEDDAGSARGGGGARVLSAAPSQVTASTEALPTAESATARVQRAAEPCDAAALTEAAVAQESDQKPRARRPTPAAWACSACTFENQARRTRCEMCRTVRVPAAAAGSEPERSAAEPRVEPIALASRGEQHACAAPRPSPLRAARATASGEGGSGRTARERQTADAPKDARAAAPIDEPPQGAAPRASRAPRAVRAPGRENAPPPRAASPAIKPAPHAGEVALATSGMRSSERDLVLAVAQAVGCADRTLWVAPREEPGARATHVVVDDAEPARRTLRVLFALARGAWLVRASWVHASLEAGVWVDEAPHAVASWTLPGRAPRGVAPAPRRPLCGFAVHVSARVRDPPREVVERLVIAAGGTLARAERGAALVLVADGDADTPTRRGVRWLFDAIESDEPLRVSEVA